MDSSRALFSVAVCLQLVAMVAAFLLAMRLARWQKPLIWQRTKVPDLPVQPTLIGDLPIYTAGGLVDVLRHAEAADKRLQALMAVRRLPDRDATPIIRLALRDLSDDVRLFAYSLLDHKSTAINVRIDRLRAALEGGDGDLAAVHARLAAEYWELGYRGLVGGEIGERVLEKAWEHAGKALGSRQVAAMHFLRGRIALARGCLDVAREELLAAERHGITAADTAMYLAELAYRERRFDQVPGYLERLPEATRRSAGVADVVACWA